MPALISALHLRKQIENIMKTILNTLIALFILFLNSESFANVKYMDDHSTNCMNSYVPVSPRDWTANDFEVVWGNPDAEAPENLAKDYRKFNVPVPAKVWEETAINEVPENLGLIKAKFALVPVPVQTRDGITISAEEISELNKI